MKKVLAPSRSATSTPSVSVATSVESQRSSAPPNLTGNVPVYTSIPALKDASVRNRTIKPHGHQLVTNQNQIIHEERSTENVYFRDGDTSPDSPQLSIYSVTSIRSDITEDTLYETSRKQQSVISEQQKKCALYMRIAFEGDLAGFQIAWILIALTFIMMKPFDFDTLNRISWIAIVVIPLANFVLTGIFDGIIRNYQSKKIEESLRKKRFLVLWIIKVIAAVFVTNHWIWGAGSFMTRFSGMSDYRHPTACFGQVICVYGSVIAATMMSELMITTVLINSEHNINREKIPKHYRLILLFIRPFVWVYNRTMVMFLCFYAIYGLLYTLFLAGWVCDHYCESSRSAELQTVGTEMIVVPFTVPGYLLQATKIWEPWDKVSDDEYLETYIIAFLCQSFYVDTLNSIWLFSRKYILKEKIKPIPGLKDAFAKDISRLFKDEFLPSPKEERSPRDCAIRTRLKGEKDDIPGS